MTSFDDYLKNISDNPKYHVVEMDTVIGRIGGKCLLTLHFVTAHFMLAYILEVCTTVAVKNAFASIRNVLGNELYSGLVPVLLGDRGSEFSDLRSIEFDEDGEWVSKAFYCDPQQSQQKEPLKTIIYLSDMLSMRILFRTFLTEHISLKRYR